LANSQQARKRVRQNAKKRIHNMSQRSALRSAIKQLLKKIAEGNIEEAMISYRRVVSSVDKAAAKGLYHRNKAARLKQRLNNRLRTLSA